MKEMFQYLSEGITGPVRLYFKWFVFKVAGILWQRIYGSNVRRITI